MIEMSKHKIRADYKIMNDLTLNAEAKLSRRGMRQISISQRALFVSLYIGYRKISVIRIAAFLCEICANRGKRFEQTCSGEIRRIRKI